jgi:Fic family protein
MENLGFNLKSEANLYMLTLDVLKSSEIEGEMLDSDQVRSSIARKLGLNLAGLKDSDRHVDGVVEMMLDATQHYGEPLSFERLFAWHASLFPTGRSGLHKIEVGKWRMNAEDDPMQVVSGPMGKERVHFEAPEAHRLNAEMSSFVSWFNESTHDDGLIKAALAHLWFVTIHPFDDGNGRIARAITDMLLARSENSALRFYSMSAQIRKDRKEYYSVLEKTQKESMEITRWVMWFLSCLERALLDTDHSLQNVLNKAKFWEKHSTTVFNPRQINMLNMLFDGFDGKLNTAKWAKITKSSPDTALRDIQDLVKKGALQQDAAGGRSTSYSVVLE